jgi:pimeloyl-ACP methyl ester carboxylesterase
MKTMNYFETFAHMGKCHARLLTSDNRTHSCGDGTEIVKIRFHSILAATAGTEPDIRHASGSAPTMNRLLAIADEAVTENQQFDYYIVRREEHAKSRGSILLLHGLNEKSWDKYLPWAKFLTEHTGKAVILFPIAFHMNRAPAEWSNPRSMMRVAAERKAAFPAIRQTSFVNAALSSRLQFGPDRFLLSGLQTYDDIVRLAEQIRRGNHPLIAPESPIDLFGYSIGAFLAEVLAMENTRTLFDASRVFLFCGGSTLGAMSPVSRYIMDSQADGELSGYYESQFQEQATRSSAIVRLVERLQSLGTLFLSMLFIDRLRDYRESRLSLVGDRLHAIALAKDRVVPPPAVSATLETGIGVRRVERVDFPYPYTHEQPFPLVERFRTEIEQSFAGIFTKAAESLS